MSRIVSIDELETAINDILKDYGESVNEGTAKAVEFTARQGAREARAASGATFGGSGKYAKGWRSKVFKTRLSAEGVIYNASAPGLAHLLEHGHAKIVGGREYPGDPVKGRVHLAPVQDKMDELIMKTLKKELGE